MTDAYLAWFDCKRCNKPFLSYVKATIYYDKESFELTVMSKEYGDISDNSYIKSLKHKRECRLCMKGADIQTFINSRVDS